MKVLGAVYISVISFFGLTVLFLHIKSRRPLRSAAINAVLGLAALFAVNLTSRFTGVHIPVNIYTVPSSAVFGIPACAALVIMQMLL